MLDDLPRPPAFAELVTWAGPGRVVRASPRDLAGWQLPQGQKTALIEVGVPLLDGLVDAVTFRSGTSLYHLAEEHGGLDDTVYVLAAEAGTGRVIRLHESGGQLWLVNSSVNHWLCSLHLVGTWLATSTVIDHWDQDERSEDVALAELSALRHQIEALDPPACLSGDHESQFWPAALDRWLY